MAKIITEHNVAILVRELTTFAETVSDTLSLASFFVQTPATMSRTNAMSYKQQMAVSIERQGTVNSNKNQDKNKRQEQILSFINGRKSAVIKDISSLFPDVSEKTIQRELGTLVEAGKITKRGSKRWSIYMAI
jgi:predicted HTH transcriptional regulator